MLTNRARITTLGSGYHMHSIFDPDKFNSFSQCRIYSVKTYYIKKSYIAPVLGYARKGIQDGRINMKILPFIYNLKTLFGLSVRALSAAWF